MSRKNYLALFCSVLSALAVITGSCHTPKQTQAVAENVIDKNEKKVKRPNEVLTIILKAYKTSDDPLVFEVSNVVKKEGYLKNLTAKHRHDFFKATITDNSGNILDSSFFENPLKSRMEYSEDDGSVATKIVEKEEGYCNIRVNYSQSVSMLNIFDSDNKKLTTLDISKLK